MEYPSHYSRFNKLNLWLFSQRVWKQGAFAGLLYASILTIVMPLIFFIIGDGRISPLAVGIFSLFSVLIPTVIFAVVFPAFLKLITDRLTHTLGFIPTPREQVDLQVWFKRGILPESDRLKIALPKYLSSVEPMVTGRNIYKYKWLNNLMFVFFVTGTVFQVFVAYVGGGSVINYVFATLLLIFAIATLPISFKKGNPVASFMARRSRGLYLARRAELEK